MNLEKITSVNTSKATIVHNCVNARWYIKSVRTFCEVEATQINKKEKLFTLSVNIKFCWLEVHSECIIPEKVQNIYCLATGDTRHAGALLFISLISHKVFLIQQK